MMFGDGDRERERERFNGSRKSVYAMHVYDYQLELLVWRDINRDAVLLLFRTAIRRR